MPTETVLKSNDIETVAPARVGDTLGYARVSTHDQNPAAQKLIAAGLSPARAAKQLGIGRATAYRIAKALR